MYFDSHLPLNIQLRANYEEPYETRKNLHIHFFSIM